MRFSLSNLLLVVVFIASLMAVLARREPWILDESDYTFASATEQFPERSREFGLGYSPDGKRAFHNAWDDYGNPKTLILDVSTGVVLFDARTFHTGAHFLSNDAILFFTPGFPSQCALYRRRFPEWWWGHFYRPEVWASIVFGVALLCRTRRRFLNKKN